jgi:cytidylate kinase
LTREIEERDRRDLERKEAPLVMAKDAVRIDSSDLDIHQVIERVFGVVASPAG